MSDIFERVARVVAERKDADPATSYVARLRAGAPDAILKKIGEEATELVIAAKNADRAAVVHETADLWFHTLVLLGECGVAHGEVMAELERRFGRSGIDEKAARAAGNGAAATTAARNDGED